MDHRCRQSIQSFLLLSLGTLVLLMMLGAVHAFGARPDGLPPDPEMEEWYHGLTVPDGNPYGYVKSALCCDISDCRNTRARLVTTDRGTFWFIWADDATYPGQDAPNDWVKVPPTVVLHVENKTSEPLACFYLGRVRCFLPGPMT